MPTVATAKIYDGEYVSFKDFALECLRGFIYDLGENEPIPTEFFPREFYKEQLDEATDRLDRLRGMSSEEITAARSDEFSKELSYRLELNKKHADLKSRYEAMIEKVEAWRAPVGDNSFKRFMLSQLNESIEYDCWIDTSPVVVLTDEMWFEREINNCLRDIQNRTFDYNRDIKLCRERTRWIQGILKALEE